jgi:hypothetical protein
MQTRGESNAISRPFYAALAFLRGQNLSKRSWLAVPVPFGNDINYLTLLKNSDLVRSIRYRLGQFPDRSSFEAIQQLQQRFVNTL